MCAERKGRGCAERGRRKMASSVFLGVNYVHLLVVPWVERGRRVCVERRKWGCAESSVFLGVNYVHLLVVPWVERGGRVCVERRGRGYVEEAGKKWAVRMVYFGGGRR